ncbi:MAG TPA: response regulator transcription factor [Dissulfurispiraceae bacterium]|nr:response regulator transcription factor [Dissulfurispiraceae bacterium]
MIDILIADDHAVVRAGIKQMLTGLPGISAVDEAQNASEALEKIRKRNYSIVILDIAMPGKSGLDALKEIKLERPNIPVLMLSMYPEEQYAIRVLRSGASGYLTKECVPDELTTAVRQVVQGRKYISPSLAERLALNLEEDTKQEPHELLSDREYQVMCMLATGKTLTEIGDSLSISVKTVSTYRSRILEKMRLKNNAELTSYALQYHLIQ